MKFSYIDIFLLAGLGLGAVLGYRGGVTKKLFNLLMLLFSIVIAAQLMHPIGAFFSDAGVLGITAGLAVGFALVMLAMMISAILLYRRFGKTGVGKASTRTIGVILGILEASLIISFILLGLRMLDFPEEESRSGTLFYRPLINVVPKTFSLLQSYFPGAAEFREEVAKSFKTLEGFQSPPKKEKNP